MSERNLIFKILKSGGDKEGLLKSENELSRELDELKLHHEEEQKAKIIHFDPYFDGTEQNIDINYPELYAAKTGSKTKEEVIKFFISQEADIALKLSGNSQNIFRVSIIASPSIDTEDAILYYKENNKYLLQNERNEFVLGTFNKYSLPNFEFKLLFPFDRIELIKNDYEIIIIETSDKVKMIETFKNDDFISIKFGTIESIKAIVFKSSHVDFAEYKGNIISIHKSLLSDRNKLLFY